MFTRYIVLLGIAASAALGCNPRSTAPTSLRDCLLRAVEKGSPEAMAMARDICWEVFPDDEAGNGLPFGSYFFANIAATCTEIDVGIRGVVTANHAGFCDSTSRFERTESGGLSFTCVNPTFASRSIVFDVQRVPEGLDLRTGGSAALRLHRRLASCERSISQQERDVLKDHTRAPTNKLDRLIDDVDRSFPLAMYNWLQADAGNLVLSRPASGG